MMEGKDFGKVVLCVVVVATGIFGSVVPYVLCLLYPMPKAGNVDWPYPTLPLAAVMPPYPSSLETID